jgi:hypothetical protein
VLAAQGQPRSQKVPYPMMSVSRYPTEIGLVGDVKATLQGLIPLIQRKSDRAFLTEAQHRMRDWFSLLDRIEQTNRSPLRPQMVVRAVSDLIAPDAVISLDCGANTFFAARHLRIKAGQRLILPPRRSAWQSQELRDLMVRERVFGSSRRTRTYNPWVNSIRALLLKMRDLSPVSGEKTQSPAARIWSGPRVPV